MDIRPSWTAPRWSGTVWRMRTLVDRALVGLIAVGSGLALAAPSSAAAPQAGRVPVPDGRYGGILGAEGPCFFDRTGAPVVVDDPTKPCIAPQALVMFTVRGRRIVNPRVMVPVTCRASDGTTSEATFGPSSNNPSRTSPIPANGNGNISWVEEFDSSLITDATVTVNYTFRRGRSPLASIDVRSSDPELTCDGGQSFRLGDTSSLPSSVFNLFR